MIDTIRHIGVFDPHQLNQRIDIIGAGATGSYVVLQLAKLGIPGDKIHVWDFDIVEEHNLANQIYGPDCIGKKKVDALKDTIKLLAGIDITTHDERVDGTQKLGPIVFVLTDTMVSRKEIWDKSLKMKMDKKLMIETRMGIDLGTVYTINPMDIRHVKFWEERWVPDDEIKEVSACGARTSVGCTASMLASYAVWQLIRYNDIHIKGGSKDLLEHEITFCVRSSQTITSSAT